MNAFRLKTTRIALLLFCVVLLCGRPFVLTVLELARMCTVNESSKKLMSPIGRKVVKHVLKDDFVFRSFSNLSRACGYRGNKVVCPDIRHKGESVLRQTQLATIRMLRVLDVITRRHDINYWLWAGTLLGAVRHRGFIPWDNEADVCMLREDYEKLVKFAVKDIPPDIFFQNDKTDLEFARRRQNDAKFRDTTGCFGHCLRTGCRFHDGLQVDIFVLDQKRHGILQDSFKRLSLQYDDVFPLEQMPFEGYRMPVPGKWRKILNDRFGSDFMTLPPHRNRCPPGTFTGIPWYSCEEIKNMTRVLRTAVIRESFLSDNGLLWYFS